MIKKHFILFLLLGNIIALNATITYVHISCKFQYTFSPGKDSILKVRLKYDGIPSIKLDSFSLIGNVEFNKNYQFHEDWTLQQLVVELYNASGQLLGEYRPTYNFNTMNCSGYQIDDLFHGKKCIDFQSQKAGIVCASIEYNSVKDNSADHITWKNGHWSDVFGIYCEFSALNQEPQLMLKSPCSFHYKSKKIRWYESPNGITDWTLIDSSDNIYPAMTSYHGGLMYNQKRWYKTEVDTHWAKGVYGKFESQIFGPIRFYLGMKLDSLVIKNPQHCNEKTDIGVYYTADSNTLKLNAPRVWIFYKQHDTMTEQRWYLGVFNSGKTNISGKKIFPENGYPTPPDSVMLYPGTYRIRYDFTPWNGFNCKLESQSVVLDKSINKFFYPTLTESKGIKCFGDSTAVLNISAWGNDTTALTVYSTIDNMKHNLPFEYENLGAGLYPFLFENPKGCKVLDSFNIRQPEAFSHPFNLDTILCKGQTLGLNLFNKNAQQYLCLFGQDTFSNKDTLTLINSGNYKIYWENDSSCTDSSFCKIRRKNIEFTHDYLVPSVARLVDTVYSINISQPQPDSCTWKFDQDGIRSFYLKKYTLGSRFPDTGLYSLKLHSYYAGCGFTTSKTIQILGEADTTQPAKDLGYKGPLIQSFTVDPNPNDGWRYKLKIQLRDTFNVSIYKLDPVSGDIVGDIDLYKKKYYESTAFTNEYATAGVFYLKLVAGTESKTIKVVVVK